MLALDLLQVSSYLRHANFVRKIFDITHRCTMTDSGIWHEICMVLNTCMDSFVAMYAFKNIQRSVF